MATVLLIASLGSSLRNFRGQLIEDFRARGHDVHTAAPFQDADATTRKWLTSRGVHCHDIPLVRAGLSPHSDICTLLALYNLIRKVRPDSCLSYTIKPVIWGGVAAWLARIPQRVALITGLGYAFIEAPQGKRALVRWLVGHLYSIALRRSTLVIFQNPDDCNDFRRWGLLPSSVPVIVVHGSGVDLKVFSLVPFPQKPVRFLLVARLLGDKGIREYAASAERLHVKWPEAEFHLVGPLDTNPDGIKRDEVQAWQDAGNIIWQGELEDVRPAIAGAHVFVLPSYREGMPRTVLEAMSMGRPVITTDVPGCRETVVEGVNGFLVARQDIDELVGAMERFLVAPNLTIKMGANSRMIAEDKYDVHKVNAQMIAAMNL